MRLRGWMLATVVTVVAWGTAVSTQSARPISLEQGWTEA